MYLHASLSDVLFSNKVSLNGMTDAFEGTSDAAKAIVTEGGKGKERAAKEKKDGRDDDDDDIIEITELPVREQIKELLRKLFGGCIVSRL